MDFQGLDRKVLDVLDSYIESSLENRLDDEEINLFQFDELLQHPTPDYIIIGFEQMQDNLRDLDDQDLDDLLEQLKIQVLGNFDDDRYHKIWIIEDFISLELNKADIEYKLPE